VGGAEQQLVNLVRASQGDSLRHVVCQLGPPDDLAVPLQESGCEVIRLSDRPKRRYVWAYRGLAEVTARIRPDVVHSWLFHARFAATLAGRHGPSHVASIVGTTYETETIRQTGLSPAKLKAQRLVERAMARTGVRYVADSQTVKDSYVRQVGITPARIRVIPNAVDPSRVVADRLAGQDCRRRLGISGDGFLFVNVSRLIPGKGQLDLLQAFDRVAARDPEVWLALAGDGPLRSSITQAAMGMNSAGRILVLGTVTRLGELLAASDAFVFPSYSEGFGMAVAEAMLCRLPIAATDIPPLRELAGEPPAMLLSPPGDVDALTESMLRLRREPELRSASGTAAGRRAEELYSPPRVLSLWRSAYGAARTGSPDWA
jgi:glycosyltransferase involved in cell wall biosynthesis